MRIIVATHDPISPIRGGGGLRTLKTALELKKRGHEVLILAPSDKKSIGGIPVDALYHPSKEKSALFGSAYFSSQLFLKLLKYRDYDRFFVHNALACIPIMYYTKFFKRKIILDATDIHTEYMRTKQSGMMLDLFSSLEYDCFNQAKTVIVVSHHMKKHLVAKGIKEKKIHVVYDGVEVKNFTSHKLKTERPIIIHHGGMDAQDGVHLIPKAAHYIKEADFLLIGSGQELNRVKAIIDHKKLRNVHLLGWKPYKEMKQYLERAQMGLITRPDTLPNNLVLTLKLLEYWGSGTAVVASKLDAIEEVAHGEKDILFFKPGDEQDLARKIKILLADKQLLRKLQQNGRRKAVTVFNWKRLIPMIADIVEDG